MHTEKMTEDIINGVQQEQSTPDTVLARQFIEGIGGIKGPEPTRYGDWEKSGRCADF